MTSNQHQYDETYINFSQTKIIFFRNFGLCKPNLFSRAQRRHRVSSMNAIFYKKRQNTEFRIH